MSYQTIDSTNDRAAGWQLLKVVVVLLPIALIGYGIIATIAYWSSIHSVSDFFEQFGFALIGVYFAVMAFNSWPPKQGVVTSYEYEHGRSIPGGYRHTKITGKRLAIFAELPAGGTYTLYYERKLFGLFTMRGKWHFDSFDQLRQHPIDSTFVRLD